MKIKKFFIENKYKIKKFFQWFLVGILFFVCSHLIYACGYYTRDILDPEDKINLVENKQNINNENIVKVLRDKKNARDMDVKTSGSVFPVGLVRTADGLDVEFFVNVESSLYTYYYETFKEIELELTCNTYAIAYDATFNKITSTIKSDYYTFLVDIALDVEIDRYFIGVEYFDANFDDYVEDQQESVYIDLYHTYDLFYVIQDRNGNEIDGYSKTIEYNSLTFITSNSSYWATQLYDNFDNGYQKRYNPSSILIPNNYQNGYNDGYNSAISGNLGYQNGYNKGYSDGYFDGTLDTEKHYEEVVIPEQERIEYQNGYKAGYDVGLDYGEEIGYDKGYNVGKNEALNSGSGVALFDAFILIGKGFEAWNPILDMEVLPGFTLGVFIAIPIVIAVVIIVIKLLQR